MDMNMNFGVW